jgi:predicted nucleotidyltransferase
VSSVSRAKGNYRPGSDIDVTLITKSPFTSESLLLLKYDLEESSLPYLVDISMYDKLNSPDLGKHIERVGAIRGQIPSLP